METTAFSIEETFTDFFGEDTLYLSIISGVVEDSKCSLKSAFLTTTF